VRERYKSFGIQCKKSGELISGDEWRKFLFQSTLTVSDWEPITDTKHVWSIFGRGDTIPTYESDNNN